jgi:hypothetical protein
VAEIQRLRRDIVRIRRLLDAITDKVTLAQLSEYIRDLEAQLHRAEQRAQGSALATQRRDTLPDGK